MATRMQKNAGKMPAMQFYPADWRKDPGVQALGFHDRGVWFEILCLMHESAERGVLLLNGKPMPMQALANILGLDIQILNQTVSNLTTYGVARVRDSDEALYSKRMVADEKLCQVRREAGKKGGNPNLLNQKDNQVPNQTSTPSSSSSASSSSSDKDKDKTLVGTNPDDADSQPEESEPAEQAEQEPAQAGLPAMDASPVAPPAAEPPASDVAAGIIAYLNEKADRNFKPVDASLKLVRARLAEGATEEECRAVIDTKVKQWARDPKMAEFLRPATLFSATNFASYVGVLGARMPVANVGGFSQREQAKEASARALLGHLMSHADSNTLDGYIHEV